jgi:hypothetical protein
MFAHKKSLSSVPLLVFVNFALVLVTGESRVRSDEPAPADAIKQALDNAKKEYSSKIDTIKKEVLQSLDNKISAARKRKRNGVTVASLKAQKDAFEQDANQLPSALGDDAASFARRARKARIALAGAYSQAVSDYTRESNDARANAVKAELQDFAQKTVGVAQLHSKQVADVPQSTPTPAPPALGLDPKILIHSAWNFTRRLGGLNQSGAFKILDGVIYHLDADNPIGVAAVDGEGLIHLSFQGHRKIAEGEAFVKRIAPGEFRGRLNFLGDTWEFSMSRR